MAWSTNTGMVQGWERQGKADSRRENMSVTYRNYQDAFILLTSEGLHCV